MWRWYYMNNIISLLFSSMFLISTSNAIEKLHDTSDLYYVNNSVNVQCDNINNPNASENIHKHKVKYKYSHKKKRNNDKDIKYFNINSDISKNITKFQEILTNDIHSKKFKMLGDIHKKIMNNDTDFIKKLNIDENILNQYKFYYDSLITNFKLSGNNYFNIMGYANNLTVYLYILLNNNIINEQSKMNYFKRIIWNKNISSDKTLHGKNIFQVIAYLSNAISDWSTYAAQTTFDISQIDNTNKVKIYTTAAQQLQYIKEIFDIK